MLVFFAAIAQTTNTLVLDLKEKLVLDHPHDTDLIRGHVYADIPDLGQDADLHQGLGLDGGPIPGEARSHLVKHGQDVLVPGQGG